MKRDRNVTIFPCKRSRAWCNIWFLPMKIKTMLPSILASLILLVTAPFASARELSNGEQGDLSSVFAGQVGEIYEYLDYIYVTEGAWSLAYAHGVMDAYSSSAGMCFSISETMALASYFSECASYATMNKLCYTFESLDYAYFEGLAIGYSTGSGWAAGF